MTPGWIPAERVPDLPDLIFGLCSLSELQGSELSRGRVVGTLFIADLLFFVVRNSRVVYVHLHQGSLRGSAGLYRIQ